MTNKYDAVIIGAGIIGCSIAFELAGKGWKVLVADKLPAAGYGSTSASCGVIRVHYSTLDGTALAHEAYHYWEDWAGYLGVEDERGPARFIITGCLVFKSEANRHLEHVKTHLEALGIEYEDWVPDKIAEKLPIFDLRRSGPPQWYTDPDFGEKSEERMAGALYIPRTGYIGDPQLATHNVQRAAEARGAEFLFNCAVTEIRRQGGRVQGVVLNDADRIDAPVVVNAAGPHSFQVNEMAGVAEGMNIKTRALRVEVAHVPSPPGFDFERDGITTSDSDIGCYFRAETGNHILAGSEDPDCDPRIWVDPDDYNKNFSDQWTAQVHRLALRIPSLGIPRRMQGVVDLYDVSDDWIPIYDKSDLGGFYMAVGTSGNQFKNAPVVGIMMAELIQACENDLDHDRTPLQFYLKHIDRTVSVGFYSRLRKINPESSFSVVG